MTDIKNPFERTWVITMIDQRGQPDICEIDGTIVDVRNAIEWLTARCNTNIQYEEKRED